MWKIWGLGLAGCLLLAACRKAPEERALRLGMFPNLTHAQGLVGEADGSFTRALRGRPLEIKKFNAGPSAMEALLAGELDVSYAGSGPTITAFIRSRGALRLIAGAASGGAELVSHTARTPEDLRGKRVATPQLGNTQDIALRHWLRSHGLTASSGAGGDVTVTPVGNPDILSLFRRGEIEAAWVPEPWGARLIAEGGGQIMVDERTLWKRGRFATTVLVAATRALQNRPDEIKSVLRAHLVLTSHARADPKEFARRAGAAFAKITGKALPEAILLDAFSRIELTTDPMEAELMIAARHAKELGFLPSDDIAGLVDASLLEQIRTEKVAPRP